MIGKDVPHYGLLRVGVVVTVDRCEGSAGGPVVQLHLSAARRLWQDLPIVVRFRDRDAETRRRHRGPAGRR